MLIFSRNVNASVSIGDSVSVKVLKIGGTRVTLGVEAPPEVRVQRSEVDPAGVTSETNRGLRIMVIEDTPAHALLIQATLSRRGYTNVVRTECGEDALRLLSMSRTSPQLRPDLIFLDLELPGMYGLQVLEAIRSSKATSTIPVVVFSLHDSDELVLKCTDSGANAFVPKTENATAFQRSVVRTVEFWSSVRVSSPPLSGSAQQTEPRGMARR